MAVPSWFNRTFFSRDAHIQNEFQSQLKDKIEQISKELISVINNRYANDTSLISRRHIDYLMFLGCFVASVYAFKVTVDLTMEIAKKTFFYISSHVLAAIAGGCLVCCFAKRPKRF